MKFKAFTNWCKGVTHAANCDNSQRAGFTLAEVLITLGIIGGCCCIDYAIFD